jgi:hypothetical protein
MVFLSRKAWVGGTTDGGLGMHLHMEELHGGGVQNPILL